MSKVVKAVVVIAAVVAVVVFAPAIGAALASVAGSIGVTVAGTAIASFLIGSALSIGLAAAASLFRKTPSLSNSMADRLNSSVVPTAPRKIVFGVTAAGNDARIFETYGSKKDRYFQSIALASHRINAIKGYYVESDLVWNGSSIVSHSDGIASVRGVTEGNSGNAAPAGSGAYWTNTSKFTGCAYLVVAWKLSNEAWPGGIPSNTRTIVEGCPVYDPRLDSTVGGSGPHRINDQNTWSWRNGSVEIGRNPALCLLTYLLGWNINGTQVWGMGIPVANIDLENFKTYANVCEEQVATQVGGWVQRYHFDGIFSTADSHDTVMNVITASMGSTKLVDVGGAYTLVGGYDDTAGPKVHLTLDDIVGAGGSSTPYIWSPAPASRERFNVVRGRFADPENLYQLSDWGDPIEQPPLADEIPRTMNLDLGGVSRPETCQRIAKQFLLREYLCPGKFSATFGPRAFASQVGSLITLTIPSLGWNAKLFRVEEQTETHDMFYQTTLREESATIYAWDREEKPLPANIRPTGYDPKDTLTPQSLSLSSKSYEGANDYHVSEVHVGWTPETSGRVSSVHIQSRPVGESAWSNQASGYDPSAGEMVFTSNAPGISVEVRARFRMTTAIYGPWVSATVVTAPVIVVDHDARDKADQAQQSANAANTAAGTALGAVKDASGNIIPSRDLKGDIAALDAYTRGKVSEIEAAYGDSAGAAAARDAAIAARDATLNAKALVDQALIEADQAADAAQTSASLSSTKRDESGNFAQASKDARDIAVSKASEAGGSATAASQDRIKAETAKGLSEAAEGRAATSASNAAGSESRAANYESLASQARTDAGNHAIASAGSASTASTKAGEAGGHAVAANQAKLDAQNARDTAQTHAQNSIDNAVIATDKAAAATTAQTLTAGYVSTVKALEVDYEMRLDTTVGDHWTANPGGVPADSRLAKVVAWGDLGSYLVWNQRVGTDIYAKRTIPVDTSKRYRISTRIGAYMNGGTPGHSKMYVGFVGLDAAGNPVDHGSHGSFRYAATLGQAQITDGQLTPFTQIVTGEGNDSWLKFPPGTKAIKLMAILNYEGGPLNSYIDYIRFEDVDAVKSAETFAQVANDAKASASDSAAQALASKELSVTYGSGGNLIPADTECDTLDGWGTPGTGGQRYAWGSASGQITAAGIDLGGDAWRPSGGHNISALQIGDSQECYYDFWTDYFPITPGKSYEFSVYVSSHRCRVQPHVGLKQDGGSEWYPNAVSTVINNGGNDLNAWERIFFTMTAGPQDRRARILLRKLPTLPGQENSYAWFTRPFFAECAPGKTKPAPYSIGNGTGVRNALSARIGTVETATTDGRFASASRASDLEARSSALEGKVGGYNSADLSARISGTETAITDGRFASAGRATNLEAQLAGNVGSNLLSRIAGAETAFTDGRFASAGRATNLEAQMAGNAGSNLLSRIAGAETAFTDGRFAQSSTVSQLRSEYDGTASTVSTQASTIADSKNKLANARLEFSAVTGGGRAQLTLRSDTNGGAGVDIVGDVAIGGNLLVSGSITSGKMAPSSVQQVAFQTLGYDVAVPKGYYGGGGGGGGTDPGGGGDEPPYFDPYA